MGWDLSYWKKSSCLLLVLAFVACTDPPVELNSKERALADSLYTKQVHDLKLEMDSLCQSKHEALLSQIVDSIVQMREIELKRLMQ